MNRLIKRSHKELPTLQPHFAMPGVAVSQEAFRLAAHCSTFRGLNHKNIEKEKQRESEREKGGIFV